MVESRNGASHGDRHLGALPHPGRLRAEATVRAYEGDIRSIAQWCASLGFKEGLQALNSRLLFAYLAGLAKADRTPSTIRRRLTALRSVPELLSSPELSAENLFAIERRVLGAMSRRTAVLVVSDDAIVREGLLAVLSDQGILTWSDKTADADVFTVGVWDYVIVWLPSRNGIEPFSAIEWIQQVRLTPAGALVPVLAIFPTTIAGMVRLRLAEAGATYAMSHRWLSDSLNELPHMLEAAAIPSRFHVETPFELRQRLGLRHDGTLEPLMLAASAVPPEVWTSDRRQSDLPISRAEIARLRRIAGEEAGIPPPPFSKYASSVREPPTLPSWATVLSVVRAGFNYRPADTTWRSSTQVGDIDL